MSELDDCRAENERLRLLVAVADDVIARLSAHAEAQPATWRLRRGLRKGAARQYDAAERRRERIRAMRADGLSWAGVGVRMATEDDRRDEAGNLKPYDGGYLRRLLRPPKRLQEAPTVPET